MSTHDIPEVAIARLPADPVILDVREDDEWAAGHIAGAAHVPLTQLPARLDALPDAERLFVVCRSGGRSARATAWLCAQGIDAVNVEGGMMSWAAASRPMLSESGRDPEVL